MKWYDKKTEAIFVNENTVGEQMKLRKQILAACTLSALFFGSTCIAQQDEKALFEQCLKSQAEEFQPLARERDAVQRKYSSRTSAVRYIIRWLEKDPETADAHRLEEIATLEAKLEAFKANANFTSAEAIKDVATAVESANVMVEDISDELNIAIKPLARKKSSLQRKYEKQEKQLKPVLAGIFRESGGSEATTGLTRAYGSFSYSAGIANASYKRGEDRKTVCNCFLYLGNDKKADEELGEFADKYPIASRSKYQLDVIVGSCRVSAYSTDKQLLEEGLDAAMSSLVDFEKLERLLAK